MNSNPTAAAAAAATAEPRQLFPSALLLVLFLLTSCFLDAFSAWALGYFCLWLLGLLGLTGLPGPRFLVLGWWLISLGSFLASLAALVLTLVWGSWDLVQFGPHLLLLTGTLISILVHFTLRINLHFSHFRFIHGFLIRLLDLLWACCLLLIVLSYPSALALCYFLYALVRMTAVTTRGKNSTTTMAMRNVTVYMKLGYGWVMVHALLLFVFQVEVIRNQVHDSVLEWIGLPRWCTWAQNAPLAQVGAAVYAWSVLSLLMGMTLSLLCHHARVLNDARLQRQRQSSLIQRRRSGMTVGSARSTTTSITVKDSRRKGRGWVYRFKYLLARYAVQGLAWTGLALCLTFPSFLTLPLFLWSAVMLWIVPPRVQPSSGSVQGVAGSVQQPIGSLQQPNISIQQATPSSSSSVHPFWHALRPSLQWFRSTRLLVMGYTVFVILLSQYIYQMVVMRSQGSGGGGGVEALPDWGWVPFGEWTWAWLLLLMGLSALMGGWCALSLWGETVQKQEEEEVRQQTEQLQHQDDVSDEQRRGSRRLLGLEEVGVSMKGHDREDVSPRPTSIVSSPCYAASESEMRLRRASLPASSLAVPPPSSKGARTHAPPPPTRPTSPSPSTLHSSRPKPSWLRSLRLSFLFVSSTLLQGIYKYAYLIALLVVYLCALQAVTLLNAVYLGFFTVFLLFPNIARRAWIGLVVYTECVMLVLFLWQVESVRQGRDATQEDLWGLRVAENLWALLRFDLVILVFSVVQWHVYVSMARRERLSRGEDPLHSSPTIESPSAEPLAKEPWDHLAWVRYMKTLYRLVHVLLHHMTLLLCYLTFSLIAFLGPVTLFDLGYFLLVVIHILLYQLRCASFVRRSWIVVCIYPALVATSCYVYQFPALQSLMDASIGVTLVRNIGWVPLVGPALFEFLFQHVAALFLCVFQYRLYHAHRYHSSLDAEKVNKLFRRLLPFWWLELMEGARRLCVVHLGKVIVLLVFLSAIQTVTVFGCLSLCYVVLVIPFIKTQSRTRLLLLIWMSALVLVKMVYQLDIVNQQIGLNEARLSFIGLTVYKPSETAAYQMRFEILTIYAIALRIIARRWKATTRMEHPDFPVQTSDWPLLDFYTHTSMVTDRPLNETPANRAEWHKSIARHWFYEFALSFNYWVSNFYSLFGWEICKFVHLIVAVAKLDVIGLAYLCVLGVLLLVKPHHVARVWGIYLVFVSLCMVFQYISALGFPPGMTQQYPWYSWPAIIGFPNAPQQLYITPDFFLFFFCALQSMVFYRAQLNLQSFAGWFEYSSSLDVDFTIKPRSRLNQVRFIIIRYFIWLSIIMAFAQGTAAVNVLCFVFLCFSLYYISTGEGILLDRKRRQTLWILMIGYTYIWFMINLVYQIPAHLIPLPNGAENRFWTTHTRVLLGLSKQSRTPVENDSETIYTDSILIGIFLFLFLLFQGRVNSSRALYHVAKFIRKDTHKALSRARDFRNKQRQKFVLQSLEYENEVSVLRKSVLALRKQETEVTDWVRHFRRREDEDGYVVVSQSIDDDGRKAFDFAIDPDDQLISKKHRRIRASKSIADFVQGAPINEVSDEQPGLFSVSSSSQIPKEQREADLVTTPHCSVTTEPETVIPIQQSNDNDNEDWDQEQWEKKNFANTGFWNRCYNTTIKLVYQLSVDYTDLYATESQTSLIRKHADSKLWTLFRGVFYAICAHTAILAYLAVFINQIYHSNVLSTIPMLAVLLVGMLQRPHPKKRFWEFIIVFIEITVLIKYLFQLNIWKFNVISCPFPSRTNAWVYFIGIQKSCSTFFVEVLSEFAILLCCIAHRGLMRRLGLWKSAEIDDLESIQSGGIELQEVIPQSAEQTDQSLLEFSDNEMTPVKTPQNQIDDTQVVEDEFIIEWKEEPIDPWYKRSWRKFYQSSRSYIQSKHSLGRDYYLGMFMWDLIVFILTIVFWASFSGDTQGDLNIEFLYTVFSQNTVPPLFTAILVINFCLIIFDRAIYTAKSMLGKLVLQYVTVLAFTVWIFFFLPTSNNRPFSALPSLQIWFFAKCVYWYYSGLQLKSGYPRLRLKNFLMRNYSDLNRIGFIVYRAIPFVWEFRAFVDWTISPTCLDLYNWLKFEDIFANLYMVKSGRMAEKRDSRRFGEPQGRAWKMCSGTLMIIGMIILLWFPLLLLSIPGTTKVNPVESAQIQLAIHGFEPFYVQDAPKGFIYDFTASDFNTLKSDPRLKISLPSYFSASNFQRVSFQATSMNVWSIAPPIKQVLASILLDQSSDIYITCTWELSKNEPSLPSTVRGFQSTKLSIQTRAQLSAALTSTTPNITSIPLTDVFPRYIRAFPNGPAANLMPDNSYLSGAILTYRSTLGNATDPSVEWWELSSVPIDSKTPPKNPEFIILSDNVPAISSLSSYGIIGLYIAVVFAVGRFIRILITDLTLRIMYEDLPNPDPILRICSDTILAREFGDYETEETLYWQLITIFRSPPLLLEKTKVKEE